MHVSEPVCAHVSKYRPKFNSLPSLLVALCTEAGSLSWIQHPLIQSVYVAGLLWGVPCLCLLHTCSGFDTAHVLHIHISWYRWNILTFFLLAPWCGDRVSNWISHVGADCTGAFCWGSWALWLALLCLWGAPHCLDPVLLSDSRDFSSVVRSAPEWESEGSNLTRETSKNKGAILISFTGATRVVPPHISVSWLAFPSSQSKVTQQPYGLKISACPQAGSVIEGKTYLLPQGLCLQRPARRVLYRFMTCLSQYLFYSVAGANNI